MSTAPVHSLTTTPTEKHDPVELEQASSSKSEDSGHNDIDPEFSPDEQRRIVRRIDKRLIVTCGLMYCVSLMDRTNLSNAAIAGMVVELNLIGFRYVSLHIGFGFPNTWGPMIPLRLILGVLEAGFFPGGWRWIFIMEGILTCVVGIIGYFFLVDFPDKAARTSWAFLNERECQFITRRIAKDRGDAELEPFNLKKWAASGLDLKIWGFALIFFSITTQAYAIAYFLPIILHNNMGFSIGAAQCLVAPPYAFAGILMFATSWAGDRWRMRGPVLIFNCFICFVGLPLMGFVKSSGVRYFGVFLTTAGVNANIPAAMAYQANNIRGQWKRAFASATLVGFGGIGGIAGSLIFRSQDAPHYRPGIYAAIACDGLIVVIVGILSIYFRRCNQKVSKGQMVIEGLEGFRYTI
ncbi:hypothetical protein LTR93_000829 [Exophiala xenobiotica]|nr:hypothetical protein LTR93_000829 [Exophiala xenobiotica]